MLKKYMFLLVFFNTFNFSFCAGLQFAYGSPSDPNYTFSVGLAITVLALPTVLAGIIEIPGSKGFGEFRSSLRNDITSKTYFVVSILFRTLLGLTTGLLNDV